MDVEGVVKKLRSHANPKNVEGMARFGINPKNTLGVNVPIMRKMAKEIKRDHALAQQLYKTQIHEARILASMIDEPKLVSEKQMDAWICDFDSWDVCDQTCMNLFWQTPFAYTKAVEWSKREKEFEKRAGFALMAVLAWKDKEADDKKIEVFLDHIKRASKDDRNYVKKAVNWALRQIGKRNPALNKKAIKVAREISKIDSKAAKWIAKDALRELESEKIQERLKKSVIN